MNGPFRSGFPGRIGLPGAASLAINGLMVLMMLYLGAGQMHERKEPSGLTVWSLSAPSAAEATPAEPVAKPAEAKARPSPPAIRTPPPPTPEPLVTVPFPVTATPPAPVAVPIGALPTARPDSPSAATDPTDAARVAHAAAAQPSAQRQSTIPGSPAGTSRSYAAKVRSWLYAHKIYPRRAKLRREEGVVRVWFVIDRRGHLLEGRILEGSGIPVLDEEGRAMLHRASPYPAAPQDLPGDRIEFTAPIEFTLPA